MRKLMAVPVSLALGALLSPVLMGTGESAAASHAATSSLKCRSQTFTYKHNANKHKLTSKKGPHVRTSGSGTQTLDDNRVTATYEPVPTDAKFVNVTTDTPDASGMVSRLESVTLYPKGKKKKHWKIVKNPNKDFVYKYDLLKDYAQVQLPVNGTDGQGRATPKINKVVVKAKEDCFTTQ
jgi:hypothetical protein